MGVAREPGFSLIFLSALTLRPKPRSSSLVTAASTERFSVHSRWSILQAGVAPDDHFEYYSEGSTGSHIQGG